MATLEDLRRTLGRIDGRGYKAYKDIKGGYAFEDMTLFIDHVQGDPFAAPSKVRIRVPQRHAAFPATLFENPVRRMALEDYIARQVNRAIRKVADGNRGSGKSGMIDIDAGRQEVLDRTALVVTSEYVEARIQVGLPAAGRKVRGHQATEMLCEEIPRIAERAMHWASLPQERVQRFVECIENQAHIRDQLEKMELVAFVANGAILPRVSGASDRPLPRDEAVPFRSPDPLLVTVDLLNPIKGKKGPVERIVGMGIPRGVTLIVGGGYHGKSTLLKALERSVYPHIPGDGREFVVTVPDAVKIRAEDGRRVEQVNISPFISDLPYGRSTTTFSSDDASGSTSQAANIIEALETGTSLLLLDEDTSATNFMVRDARMQALVHKEHEPITPFVDRVRELYDRHGVSTVLVMGGSGDYFDTADTIIMMREYLPYEMTAAAQQVAQDYPTRREMEAGDPIDLDVARIPQPESFDPSRGKRRVKIDAKALDLIRFGNDNIDLRMVEQLVDFSQTRAVGNAIHLATEKFMGDEISLQELLDRLEAFFNHEGLDALDPFHRPEEHPGNFARPRRYEIAAAINRLRTVRMRQKRLTRTV